MFNIGYCIKIHYNIEIKDLFLMWLRKPACEGAITFIYGLTCSCYNALAARLIFTIVMASCLSCGWL
jgi:hypothetical protein